MSALGRAVDEYVAVRRALGSKLPREEQVLHSFVEFLEAEGASTVTTELAVRWATLSPGATRGHWDRRLSTARGFARHMSAVDPRTEVPPPGLLGSGGPSRRAEPYLYSPEEVSALLAAARSARSPFVAATFETLLGLLAVSGMRVGEALGLDAGDLDAARGLLVVRHSKFERSREVPLHPSAVRALTAYAASRDARFEEPVSPSFFVSQGGRRLRYEPVWERFTRIARQAGLQRRSPRCRPRMHDFRHAFACATLEDWYRRGVDVQAKLPLLSTYLGHVDPASTYWYLSGKPELLALAADRLENALEVLS